MTTERLNILAAALALGEFTTPELAAFTGANPNTVRGVLYREQAERGLFERRTPSGEGTGGRQPVIWRLKDPETVFTEIEREESSVADLRGPGDMTRSGGHQPADREALITSAEKAVAQSCESDNAAEQRAFVTIATNLLRAADPDQAHPDSAESGQAWWERGLEAIRDQKFLVTKFLNAAPADRRSQLARSGIDELVFRASRTAAFTAMAARRASGQQVDVHELRHAAETVAASSTLVPLAETMEWVRRIVHVSSSVGSYLPPVAVMMRPGRSPLEILPVVGSNWRCIRAQASLERPRFTLWAEDWAESLLASDLMPGLIVAHDDTLESNDLVDKALADAQRSGTGPVTIVASTAEDLHTVARVTQGGCFFYPLGETIDGLLETVRHAVARTVGIAPVSLVSGTAERRFSRRYASAGEPRVFAARQSPYDDSYHIITASRVAALPYSQLQYWTQAVLARSDTNTDRDAGGHRPYSFREIVELKVIKLLHDSGASLLEIRAAVSSIREPADDSLPGMTVITDGPGARQIDVGSVVKDTRIALSQIEDELKRRLRCVAQAELYAASVNETSMRSELGAIIEADKASYRSIGLDIVEMAAS